MPYHKYTTRAFVLDSSDIGESNKLATVFTEDLGMVKARVQGVRNLKSKLRPGLQKYSFSLISFIYGKNEWKVVGAEPQKNFFYLFSEDRQKLTVCLQVLNLVKKLVSGEEKDCKLFSLLQSSFEFLEKENLSKENLANFECVLVLRIVGSLGFLAHSRRTREFIESSGWDSRVLQKVTPVKKEAIRLINRSLTENGLY